MAFSPYGETVCFSVKPIGRVFTYSVSVDRKSKSVVVMADWTFSKLICLFSLQLYTLTQTSVVLVSFYFPVVDFQLFLVFVAGIFLFFYAKTLSQ